MSALKRKLWVEVDEERALVAKRRKNEIAERKDSAFVAAPEMQETYAELPQPSPTTAPAPEVFKPSSGRKDKLFASAKIKEKEDSIMADVDALVETLATPLRQEKKAVPTPSSVTQTPPSQISQTPQNPLSSVFESSKLSPSETFLNYTPVMDQAAYLCLPTHQVCDRPPYLSSPTRHLWSRLPHHLLAFQHVHLYGAAGTTLRHPQLPSNCHHTA